jgi:hypothetical protein
VPDRRELVTSIVTAVVAALACGASIQFATPIDRALPFLAVVAVCLATIASRPVIAMAVLPLIAIENVIADEPVRLLAIGIVMAIAFIGGERTSRPLKADVSSAPLIVLLAVLVLRWIPLHDVVIWRELIILAGAVAVAYVMQGATLAVVLALFSPAWPAKVAVVLFAVAILAALRLRRVKSSGGMAAALLGLILAFFPWSGVMARGWMAFIRQPRQAPHVELRYALPPGRTMTIEVPAHAVALVVSGANVQRLPCGAVLGWMNGAPIAAPDWGFMRREQFFASRNCYPRNPAGRIRDYGWSAWIDGGERILLPYGAKSIRIAVNPQLPKNALLQIEAFE